MRKEYYAHISESHDNEKLIDHLELTGKLAALNGSSFHHEAVCKQLGLLHDIGKYTENFQQVLEKAKVHQDHAIIGGIYYNNHGLVGDKWMKQHMALIMACHHSFLYSNSRNFAKSEFKEERLDHIHGLPQTTRDDGKNIVVSDMEEYSNIQDYVKENNLLYQISPEQHFDVSVMTENEKMFYTRMLYSCLVDADYSATAEYNNPGYLSKYFYDNKFDAFSFSEKLHKYHDKLVSHANQSEMNYLRNEVYKKCHDKGSVFNGFVTLSAPTGTGKTLALMEFALENAKKFHKNRIIIVLPFLSIIEQNGNTYKEIFGDDIVLIDNSQTDYTDDVREESDRWSSPIIVTTSVKFFETLFSCKATDIRKLHNVTNSVVIFDECQTLPSDVLNSSIEVLQSLTKYYNTTVLFSTATKPSYEYRNKRMTVSVGNTVCTKKDIVVSDMQWQSDEIIDDVQSLFNKYDKIKNTEVICDIEKKYYTCKQLVDYYDKEDAAVYIFNTVKHATVMYKEMVRRYGENNCFIITSNFCAKDKLFIIKTVNEKLKNHEFVRLAATQCIEAGVDFDFPVGAREYAPFDSIIQSSGRVNRNGNYNGKFLVFTYQDHSIYDYPSAGYQYASNISYNLASDNNGLMFYDVKLMDDYFRLLYQSGNYGSDKKDLIDGESEDYYEKVADNYNLIDNNNQIMMIVEPQFEHNKENYQKLLADIIDNDCTITKGLMRKLAPYTVSLYCSRSFDPCAVATQLKFRKHDNIYTNWFLLRDDKKSLYGNCGFNTKSEIAGDRA